MCLCLCVCLCLCLCLFVFVFVCVCLENWFPRRSFLKRLLKPELYEEWIYYYGIEESEQVKKQNVIFLKYLCKSGLNLIDHTIKIFATVLMTMMQTRSGLERSLRCPWTQVTPWSPWWGRLRIEIVGPLVNISANQVLRQAVSDSLDTFASVVNTACESDLDGEVKSSSSLS